MITPAMPASRAPKNKPSSDFLFSGSWGSGSAAATSAAGAADSSLTVGSAAAVSTFSAIYGSFSSVAGIVDAGTLNVNGTSSGAMHEPSLHS